VFVFSSSPMDFELGIWIIPFSFSSKIYNKAYKNFRSHATTTRPPIQRINNHLVYHINFNANFSLLFDTIHNISILFFHPLNYYGIFFDGLYYELSIECC
jgi:hypothetical protein